MSDDLVSNQGFEALAGLSPAVEEDARLTAELLHVPNVVLEKYLRSGIYKHVVAGKQEVNCSREAGGGLTSGVLAQMRALSHQLQNLDLSRASVPKVARARLDGAVCEAVTADEPAPVATARRAHGYTVPEWILPQRGNAVPGPMVVKLMAAVKAEQAGFDAGYHRAMRRDPRLTDTFLIRALDQERFHYVSWLSEARAAFQLSVDVEDGHWDGRELAGPPGSREGRSTFFRLHPTGLAFDGDTFFGTLGGQNLRSWVPEAEQSRPPSPAASVAGGDGARGEFDDYEEPPLDREDPPRAPEPPAQAQPRAAGPEPPRDGHEPPREEGAAGVSSKLPRRSHGPDAVARAPEMGEALVMLIPEEFITDFGAESGRLPRDDLVWVSRARTYRELRDDIQRVGNLARLHPRTYPVQLVVAALMNERAVKAACDEVGFRWRRGLAVPAEELGRHCADRKSVV